MALTLPYTLTYPCGCVVTADDTSGEAQLAAQCGKPYCWGPRVTQAARTAEKRLADAR